MGRTTDRGFLLSIATLSGICLILASMIRGTPSTEVPLASANPITYELEYLGYTVNPDLTTTWSYRVKSYTGPAVSHWELQLGLCITKDNILSVMEDGVALLYGGGSWEFSDATHILKFDRGYEPPEPPGYMERIVSFTLDMGYPEVMASYTVKGGKDTDSGLITAPGCPGFVVPEVPLGALGAVASLGVALAVFAALKKNPIRMR